VHLSLQRKAKPKEPELTTLQFRLYSQVAADDGAAEVEHASGRAVWRASEAAQDV